MKKCFVSPILLRLSKKAGINITVEPKYGYAGRIELPDGRKKYFRSTNFDLNPLGASEISRDKDYSYFFLSLMRYPVPRGKAFFSRRWCEVIASKRNVEAAYCYARKLGFPVIVKPNNSSQGFGVAKVNNRKEFFRAAGFICQRHNVFLVQEVLEGRDYRIVVLDNDVISAYERLPLSVVGNGKSSVSSLLKKKQAEFRKSGRDTVINSSDFRIAMKLKRQNITLEHVPPSGKLVALLDNANLSTGGTAKDITARLPDYWRKLAVKITREMGLRFSGVDITVTGDITDGKAPYTVLEINVAPGLDHYAAVGERQKQLVERLYLKILLAMKR